MQSAKWPPFAITGTVIALVCLAQALPRFLPSVDFMERQEWMTYDWRMRWAARMTPPAAPNLGAVLISDESIGVIAEGALGFQYGLYWPRHLYGRLVRELAAQGATVAGFDIAFGELRPDHAVQLLASGQRVGSDEFFARELKAAGNAVLASLRGYAPAALFRTNASQMGDITAEVDADGILRRSRAYLDYRVWHPLIGEAAHLERLDLLTVRRLPSGEFVHRQKGGDRPLPFPLKVDAQGCFLVTNFMTQVLQKEPVEAWPEKAPAFEDIRVWNMGIVLAARAMNLDLTQADVQPGRILLRGPAGLRRIIPVDGAGRFLIDWSISMTDPRLTVAPFEALLARDILRESGQTNETPDVFKDKLVMVGSTATGNDLGDKVASSIESKTFGISQHWNVANMLLLDEFIHTMPSAAIYGLIAAMGCISGWLTWRLRVFWASFLVSLLAAVELAAALSLFVQARVWVPVILPVAGGLLLTHLAVITYRVLIEQQERHRIRSVFAKVVSPNVVTELLQAKRLSLGGASRRITVFFSDVRGFTEFTDGTQARAEEYIREKKLGPLQAAQYLDEQAREMLMTVNLYLSVIADVIKKHRGTLDKYIGDCVMAFWGSPTPDPMHALNGVRAAIEAQRAVNALNEQRQVENQRREQENRTRAAAGQPPLPMQPLLCLGSGINTGIVTAGLMGSEQHIFNYTVFGREVNVASRLEGVSGRSRIIISEATHAELRKDDPALAAQCRELEPVTVKGIRQAVRIYEVPWQDGTP